MTLHEAMIAVLSGHKNKTMKLTELSDEIFRRRLYAMQDGGQALANQIRARARHNTYKHLFNLLDGGHIKLVQKEGFTYIKTKELEELIEIFKNNFSNLDESLVKIKLSQDKWTLKEIIGHLIDSASNNHQRFIRLQLSQDIEFPDYKNNEWLRIQNHQNMQFSDLLNLFVYINKLMANIISNIDESSLQNKWHIAWDKNSSFITLENLIIHYISHIKSHLTHFKERLKDVGNYFNDT